MLDPTLARWKKYLLGDPTRWLLETDDPSILLWYQLDIAHRPENAPGVLASRERVLYSDSVQNIFAAQNELGYWDDPAQLAKPQYTSTLWNLVLLAELGIPRTSRRARNACEFILQNFTDDNGALRDLDLPEMGYCVRALSYFLRDDPRVIRAATALQQQWRDIEHDFGTITSLWAWRAYKDDPTFADAIHDALEEIWGSTAEGFWNGMFMFPQFNSWDTLFGLRVLAEYDCVHDERAAWMVDWLTGFGDSKGRFPLIESLNDQLTTPLEPVSTASRWITLNALRVITKLVLAAE